MDVSNTEYVILIDDESGREYDSRDWGYLWYETIIPDAQARRYTQTIAGMDGVLDLTEALGGVNFENRQITVRLVYDSGDSYAYHHESSMLRNLMDGRVMRLVSSTDQEWFWRGRVQVTTAKVKNHFLTIEITMDAGPYKLQTVGSYDAWRWNPFSFVDGTTHQEQDVTVSGSETVQLPADSARGKVTLWLVSSGTGGVSAKMEEELTWHTLKSGENRIPEIRMSAQKATTLMLRGNGTVGVDYRLGSL